MQTKMVGIWCRVALCCLGFTVIGATLTTGSPKEVSTVIWGLVHMHPHFSIDCEKLVEETPVHFFTGRQVDYLGYCWNVITRPGGLNKSGIGWRAGMSCWKAGYWLNRESPGVGALDPLRSNIYGWYVDVGPAVYGRYGFLEMVASVGVPIGFSSFEVKIEGEKESGSAVYFGINTAFEVQAWVNKTGAITCGYKATWLAPSRLSYEVEEGLEYDGRFDSPVEEFYAGFSFVTD